MSAPLLGKCACVNTWSLQIHVNQEGGEGPHGSVSAVGLVFVISHTYLSGTVLLLRVSKN